MIKKILTLAAAAVFSAGAAYAYHHGGDDHSEAMAKVGDPAPQFTAVDSNGTTHTLADFAGSTVVLEWTNHECPFVVKHYTNGDMQANQKAATDEGVVWLRVVSSAPGKQGHVTGEEANTIAENQGVNATATLLDPAGAIGKLYGAKTTPHMYVIDADQTLVYAGAIDDNSSANPADVPTANNFVMAALANIAAGEPVATAETQPYGCSVKY